MSLESRIIALAQAVGGDVKALTAAQGSLTSLGTTNKTSLVAAINELLTLVGSSGASIDDGAGDGNTAVTWSANKIFDSIEAAKTAVKNELVAAGYLKGDASFEQFLPRNAGPDKNVQSFAEAPGSGWKSHR